MHAQVLKAFGGSENFEFIDIDKPTIRPGMVLIRLGATSVNQIDIEIRDGLPIGPDLPAVLGADVAGTIEEAGAGVIDFAPGDEVYGCAVLWLPSAGLCRRRGTRHRLGGAGAADQSIRPDEPYILRRARHCAFSARPLRRSGSCRASRRAVRSGRERTPQPAGGGAH
jgi:NADPH:quinone reductase-like Zn-dependent oxidoreductase